MADMEPAEVGEDAEEDDEDGKIGKGSVVHDATFRKEMEVASCAIYPTGVMTAA